MAEEEYSSRSVASGQKHQFSEQLSVKGAVKIRVHGAAFLKYYLYVKKSRVLAGLPTTIKEHVKCTLKCCAKSVLYIEDDKYRRLWLAANHIEELPYTMSSLYFMLFIPHG